MNNQPIGILDSGVGGLTVWREIVRELPHESTIYIADSKNTPYGAKSPEEIYQLSRRLIDFLLEKQAKLIVIACNTVTVSCLDRLRLDYPNVPLIGTVPVVKTAAEKTDNKRIGILSTTRTANSAYQQELIKKHAPGYQVSNIGTDALVPLIEKGIVNGPEIQGVLQEVLTSFIYQEVDTIALGCTHYPFIKATIAADLGPSVKILDSGAAIGRQVKRVLRKNKQLTTATTAKNNRHYTVFTTGEKEILQRLLGLLDTRKLTIEVHPLRW